MGELHVEEFEMAMGIVGRSVALKGGQYAYNVNNKLKRRSGNIPAGQGFKYPIKDLHVTSAFHAFH